MVKFNCLKLAEALAPALPVEMGKAVVEAAFDAEYQAAHLRLFREKLGLLVPELPVGQDVSLAETFPVSGDADKDDTRLLEGLFSTMEETGADFTDTFVALSALSADIWGDSDEPNSRTEAIDVEEATNRCRQRILSRCASREQLLAHMSRKRQIMRLSMQPQQIEQLWTMLQTEPERVSRMLNGIPVEALMEEIGGEKRKLDCLVQMASAEDELESESDAARMQEYDSHWDAWLKEYTARIYADAAAVQREANAQSSSSAATLRIKRRRLEAATHRNPTFILRNWVAQKSIEQAEASGSGQSDAQFSAVRTVLRMLETPFADAFSSFNQDASEACTSGDEDSAGALVITEEMKEFVRESPDWAKKLICTCSS
jgi:uncharacterized protein YdiU (UPF0061 family)